VVAVIIIDGVIWRQFNKKAVVKNEITKVLAKGTDRTYFVHYDSSLVNAIAGKCRFF
jgi:hypothetical protein